jgi:replicative DNA helicase
LGNEESTKRTKLRAIQSYTGLTRPEIEFDPVAAVARYSGIKDNLVMKDVQEWDIQKMESYIAKVNPDIVIVDQADKLAVAGNFNAGHERLRELYRRLRETAKKHDCALIGVSQASAEAENRTRLTMTMMEGSRVGKAAEADLIIGIGKLNSGEEDGPDNSRFLTVMKNKLSGYHGTIPCMMEPEVSRYVV